MKLALKTIGIAIFSISMLISFGLTSNQAFAGVALPHDCQDCKELKQLFEEVCTNGASPGEVESTAHGFIGNCQELEQVIQQCAADSCFAVGGNIIQMETTSVLAAGAQYSMAWMIPVIVSAIGIAIVVARKF